MPYTTEDAYTDEYGVVHPRGPKHYMELITNPNAVINRTIPMVMEEGSITFIIEKTRKYMDTLPDRESKADFMFDILCTISPIMGKDMRKLYRNLPEWKKDRFIDKCIALKPDGTIDTHDSIYCRWDSFREDFMLRDAIIEVYTKYPDIFKPYHLFMPKPKWNRDIYIGDHYIGYQYIMMLKQSGEKGFSVRSSGAINDEALPEKGHEAKQSRAWCSSKPIRFGEYELTGSSCKNTLIAGSTYQASVTAA